MQAGYPPEFDVKAHPRGTLVLLYGGPVGIAATWEDAGAMIDALRGFWLGLL